MAIDNGNLLLNEQELNALELSSEFSQKIVKTIIGSAEFIRGLVRYCLWIDKENLEIAMNNPNIAKRIDSVRVFRSASSRLNTRKMATQPFSFSETHLPKKHAIIVPEVSSHQRPYLPVGLVNKNTIISNLAYRIYDSPVWNISQLASRLHLIWVATICGRFGHGFRYSNTIGWNTFPVPNLLDEDKVALTECAKSYSPCTRTDIFQLQLPKCTTPKRLDKEFPLVRQAHQANDETFERIYSTTPFKNDTERLEKLFELYAEMTSKE